MVNDKFSEKGLDIRIDHRSYVRQGLELIPTVHEGPNVRQMEEKGIRTDKGELNRWIKATNRLMLNLKKKIKSLFDWITEIKEELSKLKAPGLADLLITYYNDGNAGAWSRKAKGNNLKEFSEAVNYLTKNGIYTLEELEARLSSVSTKFDTLSDSMKARSVWMKELQELIRLGENYQRTKPVYDELKSHENIIVGDIAHFNDPEDFSDGLICQLHTVCVLTYQVKNVCNTGSGNKSVQFVFFTKV